MEPTIPLSVDPDYNPCIACGACCAYYRASFYWAETDAAETGSVPVELTEKLNDFRCVMKGTNQPNPRCVALLGEIGKSVRCSIYDLRASICRDFKLSYEDNIHNPGCDQARDVHGLPPLQPPTKIPETTPDQTDPNPEKGPRKRPTTPLAA